MRNSSLMHAYSRTYQCQHSTRLGINVRRIFMCVNVFFSLLKTRCIRRLQYRFVLAELEEIDELLILISGIWAVFLPLWLNPKKKRVFFPCFCWYVVICFLINCCRSSREDVFQELQAFLIFSLCQAFRKEEVPCFNIFFKQSNEYLFMKRRDKTMWIFHFVSCTV